MANCLIGSVKEIGKCVLIECLWPLVKPHFDYWWLFDNNIQELRAEIGNLEEKTDRIKQKNLGPGVEEWLKASTEKLAEAWTILPDDNIPKAYNLISRYSIGKKAKKTAEEIAKHLKNENLDLIADHATPAMRFKFDAWTMDFESRDSTEKDIIDCLKNSSVRVIGICGMGGVGKTIMAQRIGNRVKELDLFDEVLMVAVSKQQNMPKIQEEIAELLELKFDEKHNSSRKTKLRTRLTDTKRKIIILDDVWESLSFEDLGFPIESNFERCKVLLTSRSSETFNGINNIKVFKLDVLEEGEAWNLFREKAGKCVEDLALRRVAGDVAAECKRLPIALTAVGVILQNEKDIRVWNYSLSQLQQSDPTDLPDKVKHAYSSLKFSYDMLATDVEKKFFLLCCLFPEDCNIRVQELTFYSMVLPTFNDTSIEEATNKTHTLVGKFKSRFLLTDGRDKLHVKMHDVVRDVAIYIGSKILDGFLKSLTSKKKSDEDNCNWMSVDISNERMEPLVLSLFPKLRLLMLQKLESSFSDISFEGMENLNVLSFQSSSIGSLPPTLGSLQKNLQTLCLVNCEVGNISVIGELTSLKFLSCYECENITELPTEIRSLSGLRFLELNECPKLQRIPFGVISSLRQLEELKVRRSFSEWETGGEKGNAALTELGLLPKLTCLEIEISDWNLAAQDIHLSKKFVNYWIRIGSDHNRFEQRDYRKVMILNLAGAVGNGNWIRQLARETESLTLRGDGSDNINLAETENLRNLEFSECSTVKKLVYAKHGIVFLELETLDLWSLPELEEIFNLNQNVSLCNLKSIRIRSCPKLRSLFRVSAARISLLQLEVLEIADCDKLEQVFWDEIGDNPDAFIELPNLKKLTLVNLQNFTAFCQLKSIIKFPMPTEIEIANLPKLKSFFSQFRNTSR